MAVSAVEKKYQRVRDEAVEFALKEFDTEKKDVLVSFSDHECIVDIVGREGGVDAKRFIFFYEED